VSAEAQPLACDTFCEAADLAETPEELAALRDGQRGKLGAA